MTVSYTTGVLPTVTTDNNVDIAILDQSKLELLETQVSADRNKRISYYVFTDTATSYETRVEVEITLDKVNKPFAARHVTLRCETAVLATDSVTGLTSPVDKVKFFIGYEVPLAGYITVAQIRMGLSTMYSLTFPSVSSGVPVETHLTKLANLIPAVF